MLETLLILALPLALAGIGAGLMAGLFGVGGGTIIVPVLFYLFTHQGYAADTAMHLATATSLASILPTGLSSAYAHYKKGAVDAGLLRAVGLSTAIGTLLGTLSAPYLGAQVLTLTFGAFAILIGVLMLRGKKGFALVSAMPTDYRRHALGGGIGYLSSLLGIGGGTVSVPTFAACGTPMARAVGTGSALGIVIAAVGTLGMIFSGWGAAGLPPFSLGYVNGLALLCIAPFSALLAPVGAKIAHALPEKRLKQCFGVVLIIVGIKMAMKAFS